MSYWWFYVFATSILHCMRPSECEFLHIPPVMRNCGCFNCHDPIILGSIQSKACQIQWHSLTVRRSLHSLTVRRSDGGRKIFTVGKNNCMRTSGCKFPHIPLDMRQHCMHNLNVFILISILELKCTENAWILLFFKWDVMVHAYGFSFYFGMQDRMQEFRHTRIPSSMR